MRRLFSGKKLRFFLPLLVLCLTAGVFLKYSEPASSQESDTTDGGGAFAPVHGQAVGFGVSKAVRDLPEVADPEWRIDATRQEKARAKQEKQEGRYKNPFNAKTLKNAIPGAGAGATNYVFQDEGLPNRPAEVTVLPTPGVSFDGLSSADNQTVFGSTFAPPDTVGDVGPNHYVQMTNTLVRIFSKTGAPLTPPFLLSSITNVAGGPCVDTDDGDPIVNYDPLADRWILSQFCTGPVPGHQLFAVSQTGDPTGAYYVYDFVNPTGSFFDYPKVAVWPDGYYMSVNQFNQAGTAFLGAGIFAYDRVKMLQGDPTASFIYFDQFAGCATSAGQLPTDLDGTTPPPAGMGNIIAEYTADEFGDAADGVKFFEFKPNFANPAASTYVSAGADVGLAAFDARNPTGRTDIEQPGTTINLDSIGDRAMHRFAYRNLGTPTAPINSWVVNFTVNVSGVTPANAATYQAGVRWAELRRVGNNGAFSVLNQGTQSTAPGTPAGGTNSWMGSIAQDKDGNVLLGYSTSGNAVATDFPSLKYAGRASTDPANTFQAQVDGFLGTGFQGGAGSRWGDYSSMSVDPSDECSFWYTQEYRGAANNTNAFLWSTRVIGNIKFPTCTAPSRGRITGTVTACASGNPVANAVVTLPGGFLATTNAAGQYTIINVNPGSYAVSATRAGGFNTATSNVTVTGGGTANASLCLTGVPVLAPGAVTLVSESCLPANGFVDPGETVTVSLPVTNTGGANTVSDVGTLQATGGVTSPSAAQNYGVITSGGAAVSRNFTFTANPTLTCGTNITATVAHQDGATSLGNVVYSIPTGATGAAQTRSYTGPAVAVPDNVPAGVNVQLPVSGFTGTIADLNFRFDADPAGTCNATVGNTAAAMDHTFIGDLIFRLTSPSGTTVVIQNLRGGTRENICTTTLDDDGGFPSLSTLTGVSGQFESGNFAPDNPLSAFDGQNPNGTWVLNVSDNAGIDTGSMRRFSLIIAPRSCVLCPGVPTPSPTPVSTPTPTPTPTPVPTPSPQTGCSFTNGGLNPRALTETGVAAPAGFFWSEVQHNTGNLAVSNNSIGIGAVQGSNRLADNFTIAQQCTINTVTFYAYQTNGPVTTPFTAYTLRIWNGRPGDAGSTVIFGDTTTNRLSSSVDSTFFRISNTVVPPPGTVQGTTRKIWRNTLNVNTVLPAGTYWVDWASTVAGAAAHFHPGKTIAGARNAPTDNARQFTDSTSLWADVLDTGFPVTPPSLPQDFPFDVTGSTGGTPLPTPTASPSPTPSPVATPTPGAGLTVSYTGAAVTIPDNVPAGVNVPLAVGTACTISDLNFRFDGTASGVVGNTGVGVTHSWIGDLIFRLTSPSGTTVTFVDRPGVPTSAAGCANNNLAQLILDDDGGFPPVESQCTTPDGATVAFPSGTFSPNNPLSAFDGQSAVGTWTLNASDNLGLDTGQVRLFSLVFACGGGVGPTPTPTPTPAPSPSPTPTPGAGVTVSYTGAAVAIPDNVPAGVNVPLAVGTACTVSDLNFRFDGTPSGVVGNTGVGVSHSWIGDLIFRLTSPSGTTVTFMDRPGVPTSAAGCANNNLAQLTLDDDGGFPPVESQCTTPDGATVAFPSGSFSPNNPLSAFDGQSAVGTWTLNASDNLGLDTGQVRAFSLVFSCSGGVTPSPTPTPTPSPTPVTFLAFDSTTYRQDESQSVNVTINRTGVTTGGTTAFLTLASTRAIIGTGCGTGADVVNTTGNVINFTAGELSKTVTLGLCGDVSADTDETVNLTLTNITSGAGATNSAVLTINDTANQFRNTGAIAINQGTVANPYPSTITVAGATSNTFRIRVTLYDLYHDQPDNIDALLVGPNGAKYIVMGDVGGTIAVPVVPPGPGVTLTYADYPNAVVPDAGPLATGIFRPTSCEPATAFPAPAPGTPYVEPGCVVARANNQTLFGNFGGVSANGVWSLYIRDDNNLARPDEANAPEILRGQVVGGWGIELLASTASGVEVSGRVTTPDGRGLRNATVVITDQQGNRRTATTSSFGFFNFEDVEAGATYAVSVSSRRYRFTTRVINVTDTLTDVDFVGIE